jgi:hypothetical protein
MAVATMVKSLNIEPPKAPTPFRKAKSERPFSPLVITPPKYAKIKPAKIAMAEPGK